MTRFTPNIEQLPELMNVADLRHRIISQNIANINTPGYHRLDVDFEQQLREALQSGNRSDPADLEAAIVEDNSGSMRADGNNVDIDREIGHLNKNATLFQLYSQLLNSQFDTMRRAIDAP